MFMTVRPPFALSPLSDPDTPRGISFEREAALPPAPPPGAPRSEPHGRGRAAQPVRTPTPKSCNPENAPRALPSTFSWPAPSPAPPPPDHFDRTSAPRRTLLLFLEVSGPR